MRGTPGKSSKMIKPIEESSYLGGLKKMDNSLKPLPRWEIITVHKNFKAGKPWWQSHASNSDLLSLRHQDWKQKSTVKARDEKNLRKWTALLGACEFLSQY
ncbi:hypothetical protein VULLAG_LOCUS5911 [Vulpes lagopus]